jgi:hypothetical protein
MRKILLSKFMPVFLALALAPALASAQWTRSGDWNWQVFEKNTGAMTYSERYGQRIQLMIMFGVSSKCAPTLYYSQIESIGASKKMEGPFQGGFQARIDTRDSWRVKPGDANGFYSTAPSAETTRYVIALNVKENLVLELAYGQTFRILRTDTGDTDRFSLVGSAVAIGSAYRACENLMGRSNNPDLQYFNQRPPQPRQAPSQQQDTDRQFFR